MRHGCSSPSFSCSPRSLFVATCVCPRPCCRKQNNDKHIGQTMHECERPCMRCHSFGVTRRCIRTRISCAVKCERWCVATCSNDSNARRVTLLDASVRERTADVRRTRKRVLTARRTCVRCVIGASRRRERPARRSRRSWDRAQASRRAPRCGRLREALAPLRSLS